MILILSFADNAHVERVLPHLHSPVEVIDVADFPQRLGILAYAGASGDSLWLELGDGRRLALDEVRSVWNRRIRSFDLDPALGDGTERLFAWSETQEAVLGLWYALDSFWMNHPLADERAQRKLTQHRLAHRLGLEIPDTLITNRPDAAAEFIARHGDGGVVRKAFRNIVEAPRETLKVGQEEMARLEAVRLAPVIFQEYIPLALDLRVTAVAGEMFATAFRSEPQYEVDYRSGVGSAEVFPYTLPDEVEAGLRVLMRELGLAYGAIDLRVTPEGRHVFFEVNPAGEYLFASERSGQPIPQAIAAALERGGGEW
ncbi:ATP-grasp domain-containing protein [Halomonas litopenaei]|uniref:ATP-grasp domain-containing protein n=1 Tax=Halomonas litopenaei TaxID=2109328 RepID=UPI003FA015A0